MDGHKQRPYIKRKKTASPTVGLGSMFIIVAIKAHKPHNVVVVDLHGAYLIINLDADNKVMLIL